jgi:Fur family ferric uptake transcriptional regulator
MEPTAAEKLLKQHGLSSTAMRLEVLGILLSYDKPVSTRDLEMELSKPFDRVTLYRTLRVFAERKLVHRIQVSENCVAYRAPYGLEEGKSSEHLHFHCTHCDQVFCMPQIPIQDVSLPAGFQKSKSQLVVDGLCIKCNIG